MAISTERLAPSGLELALLGFLREQPAHAYELFQRMEQAGTLGLVWRLKQSHLYALLARLEAAGYLAGDLVRQGTRPPKRMLTLTAKGRTAFDEWVMAPVARGRDFRQEFLAKLYFAASEAPDAVHELVECSDTFNAS
jgi:DNA-binding PadR family transcriptional regulator